MDVLRLENSVCVSPVRRFQVGRAEVDAHGWCGIRCSKGIDEWLDILGAA